MPHLLRRLLAVRLALEELSSQTMKESPMLMEAYGRPLYKCPITRCTRFFGGFKTRYRRDEHLKGHERNHKCSEGNCDYSELGFTSEGELKRHVQLCHGKSSDDFTFPRVRPLSTINALEDAIDRDDTLAIQDICDPATVKTISKTGFLLRAVRKKSSNAAMAVMELLGTASEVGHQDEKGRTALNEAVVEVEFGTLVEEILKSDVDFQTEDLNGDTPISKALKKALTGGNFHAVRMLLSVNGIDLESYSGVYGQLVDGIVLSAAAGQNDIIQRMYAWTMARVPARKIWKWISAALNTAAFHNHESTVALLLKLGQSLGLEKHYQGMLQEELHSGLEAMTMLLMERAVDPKLDVINKWRESSYKRLIRAVEGGDTVTLMSLLSNGVDINHVSGSLPSVLATALSSDQLPMMRLLLDKGARADVASREVESGDWVTLLGKASRKGHLAAVQLLLEYGADPDNGLFPALKDGHNAVVALLLEKGARVELHGNLGAALNAACSKGHEAPAILLLQSAGIYPRGEIADIDFGESWSIEQEEHAWKFGLYEGSSRRSLYSALCVACDNDHHYLVQLLLRLLEKGAEVKGRRPGKYGRALFGACAGGDLATVQILLQSGADPNHGSIRALHSAASQDIVQLLLEAAYMGREGYSPRFVGIQPIGRLHSSH